MPETDPVPALQTLEWGCEGQDTLLPSKATDALRKPWRRRKGRGHTHSHSQRSEKGCRTGWLSPGERNSQAEVAFMRSSSMRSEGGLDSS